MGDIFLARNYGTGKWTIREILRHLTDSELIFHYRIKRVIAEPKQVIWACDQDLWNVAFSYRDEPLKNKKEVYTVCRNLNIDLAEKYFDQHGDRKFVHSETGLRFLKDEFEKVSTHNPNHIQQIQKALSV